ncbi:DUF6625 family protein [Anaerostipes butyraticus]|uniref:Uncharacterized protein n=1 Tax=Anaerostipes butyraticus TaxID=645466 RepID=A0A916Q869_9FIRM|nr:DUF6625 family protein [Anaerostipes butyraticus]GFO86209.1 hypothetical protein ANBU17_25560 [Anaerostipes butyraticus]
MKKIVLIIPYFGKFPNYFQLFLNSCGQNETIDWIIFTDIDDEFQYPGNVRRVLISFSELRKKIQKKFDFAINLEKPYKLCDYKPAYGYIFEEFIKGYDFWGYCDIDLLFGDLRKFLPDDLLESYDKIGYLGHLSICRNNKEMREAFRKSYQGLVRYKEVFSTDAICIFDEWGYPSIHHILLSNGFKIKLWDKFLDIYPYDDQLKQVTQKITATKPEKRKEIISKQPVIAMIKSGHVYSVKKIRGQLKKEEVAYVHFQKRDMNMSMLNNEDEFVCLPDCFISLSSNQAEQQIKKALRKKIINKKRIKWEYANARYWLIEKSGPVRHKFRSLVSGK